MMVSVGLFWDSLGQCHGHGKGHHFSNIECIEFWVISEAMVDFYSYSRIISIELSGSLNKSTSLYGIKIYLIRLIGSEWLDFSEN